MADINELMIRLEKLESENSYFKALLEQAGIEYTPLDATSNSHGGIVRPRSRQQNPSGKDHSPSRPNILFLFLGQNGCLQ